MMSMQASALRALASQAASVISHCEAGAHERRASTVVQIVGLDEDVDVLGGAPAARGSCNSAKPPPTRKGAFASTSARKPFGVDELLLLVLTLAFACFHVDLRASPCESGSARAVPGVLSSGDVRDGTTW